jgi:integrase
VDLRAALAAYAAILEEPHGGMADFIDAALPHLTRNRAANTGKSYRQAARRLKRVFAEFSLEQVRPKHVAAMKIGLAATPQLANHCLTVLRLLLAYALENQMVESNPVVGIKPYPAGKRTRMVSLQEYAAIYAKAGPRLQVIMDLCIRTGQRISDVLKIRRADLLPEGIRFQQTKTKAKGIVPWTAELRAIVERAKTLHGNIRSLTLLHDRSGKAPTYWAIREQWVDARTAAGVCDARIHDLRAFAATWAKKQGKNPTALLMHASPAQTERYLRDKEEPVVEGPTFGHLMDGSGK